MRVILTGGGTAGHINPALSIAETIKQNCPTAEIIFVGIRGGKEEDLVPREGYPLYFVQSMGIKRSLSWSNIKALSLAILSPHLKSTTDILKNFQPDLVIGTGGYACWPIMKAASARGIPTALHESNALPGLAVRKLQKHVDRIWLNFAQTRDLLKVGGEKIVKVGNPIRGGFGAYSYEEARRKLGITSNRKVILSFGGSLGAENVNSAVLRLMKDFSSKKPEILHFHATGKRDYEETMKKFRAAGLEKNENCIVKDYIYDMPLRMSAADLVISRAGAMTLSELAIMKKACILVPSPYVADNHQFRNAKAIADEGGAVLTEEKNLEKGDLTAAVESLWNNPAKINAMKEKIADFADPDANRRIWEEILKLIEKKH